jgi:hypothetical protein
MEHIEAVLAHSVRIVAVVVVGGGVVLHDIGSAERTDAALRCTECAVSEPSS